MNNAVIARGFGGRELLKKGLILFCVLILTQPAAADLGAQHARIFLAKSFKNARGETMPYRLFVPKGYDRRKKYPLVLVLHGGGGLGTDNFRHLTSGNGVLINLFVRPETQSRYEAFVVAPQSPGPLGWMEYDRITPTHHLRLAAELVQQLVNDYSVDDKRIYVMGQSLGGWGTFAIITRWPKLFAAAVPICGGGEPSKASHITGVPVWVFHGAKDDLVSVEESRGMVAAIKKAGGSPKYTEYENESHNISTAVVREQDLLPWLFGQVKK